MDTTARTPIFTAAPLDSLGVDPLPYVDPVSGQRMAHACYSPLNVYAPRPERTRTTVLPVSCAMIVVREVWRELVASGLDYPELVAHHLAATDSRAVWGSEVTDEEIAHARRVMGKLARVLSGGALVSL